MSGAQRLADLLPSLWRPEAGETHLLARLLEAVGGQLDMAGAQAQHVLRAHYGDSADAAVSDVHYLHDRSARGRAPVNVREARDRRELLTYPYITDLARLAALLDLPPWREPASIAESVEEYRERLHDVLDAYRLGLTTRAALAALTEAALPEDMSAPPAARRWPFHIEEPAGLTRRRTPVGVPQAGDALPPLWRWRPQQVTGAPQVIMTGLQAQAGAAAATEGPLLERYTPHQMPVGIGVGVRATLAPGHSVRLTPVWRSALVQDGVLRLSDPTDDGTDTAGEGPWTAVTGLPPGAVRALAHAPDGTLWLLLDDAGSPALVRWDGATATHVSAGAPAGAWHALAVRGGSLYLATDAGLHRCPLWPQDDAFALVPVAAVPEAVHALRVTGDGLLACAGADGLALLDPSDALAERLLAGVGLRTALPVAGRWYLATDQALLLRDGPRVYRYAGDAVDERQSDWDPITEDQAPAAVSPLPAVRALAVTADGWLWLGTAAGLARWGVADAIGTGAGRATRLHAYPDLGTGAVQALAVDRRGVLMVCGEVGVLRCTGRDLAQMDFAQGRWLPLGQAASEYPDALTEQPRAHYRWNREQSRWESYQARRGRFAPSAPAQRTVASARCGGWLELPALVGHFGTDDGSAFTPTGPVAAADLVLRVKPDQTRILSGGLPYLPSHAEGADWRYLQLEPQPLEVPDGRPWWSCEGRLFPPPQQAAPWPGHFRDGTGPFALDGRYADALWSYLPSARLALEWAAAPAIGVRVHLLRRTPDERVPDAVTARVWQLIARTRAAGVPLAVCVDGVIVHQS